MPKAILYQPNALKVCFFTKSISSFITASDTKNAVNVPTKMIKISCAFKLISSIKNAFATLSRVAPAITGIARKNENSAATGLDTPKTEAPRIVEPEREVPGINEST